MLLLPGPTHPVHAVAYSPTEPVLAYAHDQTVRLWDTLAGKEQGVLEGCTDSVYALEFSPDGKCLAAGGLGSSVLVWEVSSGRKITAMPGHWPLTTALAFSWDGEVLATAVGDRYEGSQHGQVRLWEVATGKWRADLLNHIERSEGWPQGGAWSLAYFPPKRLLAIGTGVQNVVLWDSANGRVLCFLRQGAGVRSLAFAPNGLSLAAASGYAVKLWDLTTRTERLELRGHSGIVWSVAFSPDGRAVATGGSDQTTRLWDAGTGRERACYNWQAGKVHAVAFARDGMTGAAGCDAGVVLWDVDV